MGEGGLSEAQLCLLTQFIAGKALDGDLFAPPPAEDEEPNPPALYDFTWQSEVATSMDVYSSNVIEEEPTRIARLAALEDKVNSIEATQRKHILGCLKNGKCVCIPPPSHVNPPLFSHFYRPFSRF